jgi:mono/diheme cytochrome c family protein
MIMRRSVSLRTSILCVGAGVAVLGVAYLAMGQEGPRLPAHPVVGVTATQLLANGIKDSTPNAAQLRRGQYLVAAGDCMACHVRDGGEPLAGGLGLKTPFGVIYTPNITSDQETGIGNWTQDQFYRAMHDGVDPRGNNLYPAFPYPWFRMVSRADDDAILAFLKSTPAVKYRPPKNDLGFPFNFRSTVKVWNLLYLHSHDAADASRSPEWNRGAYLVAGLGHCSGCHTPRNWLGADKTDAAFRGAPLDNWIAPDLTGNERIGLGAWSVDEIAEYLGDGRNTRAGAGGPMADVVTYSTSLLSLEDRHAMAVYIKQLAASPGAASPPPDTASMRRGAEIYSDACASCHLENGVGQPKFFPPLGLNAALQQSNPIGLEHLILAGGRIGTSASRPSPLSMPSFAWKLTDQEVADVSTFIRNSWGNQASAVSAAEVREARSRFGLVEVHLTANSGDQN